jgi:hypothetical protein
MYIFLSKKRGAHLVCHQIPKKLKKSRGSWKDVDMALSVYVKGLVEETRKEKTQDLET